MSDTTPTEHSQRNPLWSIGAVTSLTGISEATLRVWERRYHFPPALRSVGGHRQYREDVVLQLQWVKMQLNGGMRARQAICAREVIARDVAIAATLHEALPSGTSPVPGVVALQPALLESLMRYDSATAMTLLNEAAARYTLGDVVLDLIAPTLAEIGECWSRGEVEVATEHFATNLLRHQLLHWARTSPPPFHVRPVALACAPGELHEGSLLMLNVLMRQLRWPVTYLGQSFPLSDLPVLIEQARPALVVFVAMSEATAQALTDWPTWLPWEAEQQVPYIGFGGRAFTEDPTLAAAVPGTLLGKTIHEGCQRIHRLLLHLNVLQHPGTP